MQTDDLGKLLLRVSIAALLLLHGIAKVQNGIGFVEGQLAKAGLPEVLGYGVYVGEVIAPVLVILGLFVRPAALVMAVDLAMAVFLTSWNSLGSLGGSGGWRVELEALFFFGSLSIALLGSGRYAIASGARTSK